MGILIQQGIGGDEHAWSAVAALQAVLFFEALLQRMELAVLHQAFHRQQFATVCLHGEHGARFHRLPIQHHGAGAAMGGVTSDVRARKPGKAADEVDQQQPGLDHGLAHAAIHVDLNRLFLRHLGIPLLVFPNLYFPILSYARARARRVSSFTKPFLYSAGPRRSELGSAASAASCAVCVMLASSSFFPRRNSSALVAFTGVAPTLVSPMPTRWQFPPPSRVTCAATPAVAKSPTFRSSFR